MSKLLWSIKESWWWWDSSMWTKAEWPYKRFPESMSKETRASPVIRIEYRMLFKHIPYLNKMKSYW